MRQNNKYIAIPNSYKLERNMATFKKTEIINRFQLLIFFFLLLVVNVNSQIWYPVETQTIITPPYPGRLEDLGSVDVGNKITVRLQVTDAKIINKPVKFRVRITGRGITITTRADYKPEPFLITFGEIQIITGAELASYFNVDNLGFIGLSEVQYRRTGRLPEGVYQVYVDVMDYDRNNPISKALPGMLMLFENEPPLLNLPVKNDLIGALTPQNILFSWTARQNPFSAPSFRPEYRFDLWEIWPDEKNAYEVVRGSEPIFTSEHLTNTSLIYTINEPLLLTGRQYAWRVQVIDPENNVPFKNNGYSEVFTFRFGKVCPVPTLSVDKTGVSHIEVKWEGDYRQQRYQVQYREKRRENAEWFTKKTTFLNVDIDNLKSNTEYEFKVCGFCDEQPGDYSNTITAATKEETKFQCGAKPNTPDLSNMKMLNKLNKFDVIRAGDFDVLVSEASGGGGTFTGKGSVLIPYLKFIRLEVDFNNIKVNDDYRLVDGEIKTVYNLNTGLVHRPNPNTTTNNGFIEIGTVHNPDSTVTGITITGTTVTITTAAGGTVTVAPSANGNGIVVVAPSNPNSDQYVADTQTGTVYSTNPNTNPGSTNNGTNPNTGTITPLPKTANTQYKVDFLPHKQEICGIDYPNDKHPTGNYETIQLNGKPYIVPWKSIESGQFDRLVAKINGGPADSVNYYRESGNVVMIAPGTEAIVSSDLQAFKSSNPLSPEISGNQAFKQLLLSSQGNKDLDKLFAWYPEYETTKDNTRKQNRVLAGQINLASYDKKLITVHLVPVNGSNCPDPTTIQKELNSIYKNAVVQWNVKKQENITVTLKNGTSTTLDITDQNDKMDYTPEMDKVISVMKDQDNYGRKDYYLFFFNGFVIPAGKEAITGYMPYNRSFGFLKSADPVSIAHELGHGCFRLKHVFLPEVAFPQTKGTTDNLMDYATNNKTLLKYQWDEVHDLDLGVNWFEGEGEGEGEGIETFYSFIKQKIDEISSKNPSALLGVIHCEECDVLINREELKFGNIELADNASGTFYYDTKTRCLALFYHPGEGTKILFGEKGFMNIKQLVSIGENTKQLTVILDGNITLDCSEFITKSLSNYFKCTEKEALGMDYIKELFLQIDNCIKSNTKKINNELNDGDISIPLTRSINVSAVEEDLKNKLSENTFSGVKFSVQLSDDNGYSQTLFSPGVASINDSEISLKFHINNQQKRLIASIDIAESYLKEYENKVSQKAIERGIDVSVSELRKEIIRDIKSGFELMTKHLGQLGYKVPIVTKQAEDSFKDSFSPNQEFLKQHLANLNRASSDYFASLKIQKMSEPALIDESKIPEIKLDKIDLNNEQTPSIQNENLYAGEILRFWQVAQINVKHIWNEGTMHTGTWHSNDPKSEAGKFPVYANFGAMPVGACDAIIEEIMGIPLIIRTGYQIMTDKQQRQAFGQVFTKEGFNSLKTSLKDEIGQTLSDDQLFAYRGTKTATMVAFAFVTGGGNLLVKGGRKLDEIFGTLENLGKMLDGCPKLTRYVNDLKNAGKIAQEKISEVSKLAGAYGNQQLDNILSHVADLDGAIKNLTELLGKFSKEALEKSLKFVGANQIEDVLRKLNKISNIPGVDKLMDDMGEFWTKFVGSSFVLDYLSKIEESVLKQLVANGRIEIEAITSILDGSGEVLTRVYDIIIDGVYYELKSWKGWPSWADGVIQKQLIKDLINPGVTSLDKLKWVFKKTEGITDDILRTKIIAALSSKAGKEALQQAFDKNTLQFQKLFGNRVFNADDIIDKLNTKKVFDKIFQVI